jgi:hypothetical protein
MPQYQQQKKGQARVRILSKDATRAYLLMMKESGGKLQVLPNDVYMIDEKLLSILTENSVSYEVIERK